MDEIRGFTTTDDGTRIGWSDWRNDGDDIAGRDLVVLLHGITDRRESWFDIPKLFGERGWRVVALDARGHGESKKRGPYDPMTLASDVAAVLTDRGLVNPMLVGHSMGGLVATAVATIGMPLRAVVNVDQPIRLDDFGALVASIWPLLESDFHATLSAVFETMVPDGLPEVCRAEFHRNDLAADPEVVRAIWAPLVEQSADELRAIVDAMAGGIVAPYLALHGSDPGNDYEHWLTTRIASATFELWEGTLHFPHLVDTERFVDRVCDFAAAT